MKRGYVDTPDGQIHYRTEGSGETIFLLQSTTTSSEEYADMIPILGKSHRAIAMDLPGYGMSDKLAHKYSMDDYAQSAINFMNAMNIDKASIVGRGSGASVAVEISVLQPERVDKLVFSGCPYYTPEMREERQKADKFRPMEIKEDGSHLIRLWKLQTTYAPLSTLESWHRYFVSYLLAGVNAEDMHQAVFRYEMEKRLPLIKSPVLLITGPDDVYYQFLDVTKSLLPWCKTKVIEGGGGGIGGLHFAWDKAGEFSELILGFLANPGV